MNGILILAHGSREKSTQDTLHAVMDHLKHLIPNQLMETAYLQFSQKNLEAGLNALKTQGATSITVIPYFLFSGVHICEDIPAELAAYTANNPDLHIQMGKTLGTDPRLAAILADRIREAL